MIKQIICNELEATQENKSTVSLWSDICGSKNIILDTMYQRNYVWNNEQQNSFIISVFKNMLSVPIIFNKKDGEKRCIDGKQRLTTIVEYMDGKFPLKLHNEKTDEIDEYYFKKDYIPKDSDAKFLSNEERELFNDRTLSITNYKNLSYKQEVDLFRSHNTGAPVKEGELLTSMINDENYAKIFNNFCNSVSDSLTKFFNTDRKEHYVFIVDLLYVYENLDLNIRSKNDREKYMRKNVVSAIKKNNKYFIDIQNAISIIFDRILSNSKISKKVKKILKILSVPLFRYYKKGHIKTNDEFKIHVNTIKKIWDLKEDGEFKLLRGKKYENSIIEQYDEFISESIDINKKKNNIDDKESIEYNSEESENNTDSDSNSDDYKSKKIEIQKKKL
jgi:hypothetical protein